MGNVLCWFHQDLRLGDNPQLAAAIASGHAVVPVYILDDAAAGDWAMGGASRWWLHHSLMDLDAGLRHAGSRLIVQKGDAGTILAALAAKLDAEAIYTQTRGEPWSKAQLAQISTDMAARGCPVHQYNAAFLSDFGDVLSKAGTRMKVFTPFKKNLLKQLAGLEPGGRLIRPICTRPSAIPAPTTWPESSEIPESMNVDALGLLPVSPDWSGGIAASWRVGEGAALQRLDDFLEGIAANYHVSRDRPSVDGTSRLSPHLHFGEISPVTIYHAVMEKTAMERQQKGAEAAEGMAVFLSEVIWREFSYELLDQFPHMTDAPMKDDFAAFPWADGYEDMLAAWQEGRTGYPLIDAGMRELYETGWMHNRVRMITASFLTKHLLVPWQEGARWFFDTLVDADLASNSAGWQWVAGCGADASPYFRIFNPISQGTKFDAGAYTRRWCPELKQLDDKALFEPFNQGAIVLEGAGVRLGQNYAKPLVDHPTARQRALDAFKVMRGA